MIERKGAGGITGSSVPGLLTDLMRCEAEERGAERVRREALQQAQLEGDERSRGRMRSGRGKWRTRSD